MDSKKENNILYNVDWWLVLVYILLLGFGWLNIYSATFEAGNQDLFDLSKNYGKQFIWIGVSLGLALLLIFLDARLFSTFAYPIYGVIIILLVVTLLFGKEVAGSKSWLEIGGFSLQAAEFAKFGTALLLAKFLNRLEVRMNNVGHVIIALGIIFLPAAIILLQNDTGSAMVYAAFILVLFRQGLPAIFLYLPFGLGLLFLSTLMFEKLIVLITLVILALILYWFLKSQKRALLTVIVGIIISSGFVYGVDYAFENFLQPHQQQRVNVLLGKEVDMQGAGYNVHQSLIAIGSGGMSGKGYLNGTQTKYDFVPEQSTDFIFCTVGEEWGFVGSLITILLFSFLTFKLILSAEKQKARFARIYGYGVASVLLFHFAINIAMTIGLFPVIGIPLPFISYGGSSLMGFTILLFTYIKLDASEKRFYH